MKRRPQSREWLRGRTLVLALLGLCMGIGEPARSGAIELSPAEAAQLTPQGVLDLDRLVEAVRQGDLGATVRDAAVYPSYKGLASDGALRFEVVRRDGSLTNVMLLRPPVLAPAARPRYFVLYPADGTEVDLVDRLADVLDETFTTNPWSADPNQYKPRWHVAGKVGEPVSRGWIFFGVFFLVASTLLGLVFLAAHEPPRLFVRRRDTHDGE